MSTRIEENKIVFEIHDSSHFGGKMAWGPIPISEKRELALREIAKTLDPETLAKWMWQSSGSDPVLSAANGKINLFGSELKWDLQSYNYDIGNINVPGLEIKARCVLLRSHKFYLAIGKAHGCRADFRISEGSIIAVRDSVGARILRAKRLVDKGEYVALPHRDRWEATPTTGDGFEDIGIVSLAPTSDEAGK